MMEVDDLRGPPDQMHGSLNSSFSQMSLQFSLVLA